MDHPKYPHVEHLYRAAAVLKAPRVTVTEKIDGFNARLGRDDDGEFWAGTRNRDVDLEGDAGVQGFRDFARTFRHEIPIGVTLFGEWAGRSIQRRCDYGDPGFWIIDGLDSGDGWFTLPRLERYAAVSGFRRPRVFYEGPPPPLAQVEAWRDTPGIEGVVVRAYPMALDAYGHPLIAKLKSAAFAERASERVGARRAPLDLSTVQAFVAEYATAERLGHALAQVGEALRAGETEWMDLDPLDARLTGDVLRAMYQDVVREGAADYEALSEADRRMVGRVCAAATKPLLEAARREAGGI